VAGQLAGDARNLPSKVFGFSHALAEEVKTRLAHMRARDLYKHQVTAHCCGESGPERMPGVKQSSRVPGRRSTPLAVKPAGYKQPDLTSGPCRLHNLRRRTRPVWRIP